jgi:hypothetical protein
MAFVACHQVIRLRRLGALKEAIVRRVAGHSQLAMRAHHSSHFPKQPDGLAHLARFYAESGPPQHAFVFGQNGLGDGYLQLACKDEVEHVPLEAFGIQVCRYDYVRIEHNPASSHRSLQRAFPPVSANFAINRAHGKLVFALLASGGPNGCDGSLLRSECPEEVLNAHDDDLRLATTVHDKPGVLNPGPPHDLAQLRACC